MNTPDALTPAHGLLCPECEESRLILSDDGLFWICRGGCSQYRAKEGLESCPMPAPHSGSCQCKGWEYVQECEWCHGDGMDPDGEIVGFYDPQSQMSPILDTCGKCDGHGFVPDMEPCV